MPETPQGTPQPAEQLGNGTQPQEQAQQQNDGQQQQAAPPQPSVEELRQQLEAERQQREHYQQQYQNLQPEYTRARQALAAYAGGQLQPNQPPPDPVASLVQKYGKKFDPSHVEVIGQMMQDYTQGIREENAQLRQQYQAVSQASQVDYYLSSLANQQATAAYVNPQTYDQVRQAALQLAQRGGQLDQETLLDMAIIADARAKLANPQRQQQQFTPQPPQGALPPQIFSGGMNRITPGYAPQPAPQNQALDPAAQRVAEEMKARFSK